MREQAEELQADLMTAKTVGREVDLIEAALLTAKADGVSTGGALSFNGAVAEIGRLRAEAEALKGAS